MTLSSNIIYNTTLKKYELQTKDSNIISNKSTNDIENQQAMQESVFKAMLIQMMGDSGNSMMAEIITNALSNGNSYSLDD